MSPPQPDPPRGPDDGARDARRARGFALRDSTPLLLRPILPEDKDRLQDGLHELSLRSRSLRFGAAVQRLPSNEARYPTEIDYADHMAWMALDPNTPGEPAVGVARCVRTAEDPAIAAEDPSNLPDTPTGRAFRAIAAGRAGSVDEGVA